MFDCGLLCWVSEFFPEMVNSIGAAGAQNGTFDCSKHCQLPSCTIDWSRSGITTMPSDIGLLACRSRIMTLYARLFSWLG